MTDTLRELAEQHPELLTRECECVDENGLRRYLCVVCTGTGRRLLTLEETINELQRRGHIPIMFWGDEAHGSTVECCPDETCGAAHRAEGTYHREAAYRLLIKVSRD